MKHILPLILCLGFQINLHAQVLIANQSSTYLQNKDNIPKRTNAETLRNVLKRLESKYEVRFIYGSTVNADKILVNRIPQGEQLDNILNNLLEPNGLHFKKMDAKLYVISVTKNETIKPLEPSKVPMDTETDKNIRSMEENSKPSRKNKSLERTSQTLDKTISGTIYSAEDNTPIPGVNVIAKGTTIGTVTDADGKYTITFPDNISALLFSSIGYITQEVDVSNLLENTLDIKLAVSVKVLNDIVVIGYGEREKKDVTGAVSSIKADDIAKSVFMQPELAMQGRMPGVFVSSPGGSPNGRPTVRIRGVSTFGYAEPLYVVDGIPLTEYGSGSTGGLDADIRGNINVLNLINPNDIESISVLKDASAAAIYGVRASNGVILITTKSGHQGKPKVEFNASRGVQNIRKKFDMLDVPQYTALYNEAYANNPNEAGSLPAEFNQSSPNYLGNLPTVDWQTPLINKNAVTEDYSAKVYGGNESTNYYVSGGYGRTQSTLVQNNMERYTLAMNLKSKISKMFEVGTTFRLGYVEALDNTQTDLGYVARTSPWQKIYDPNHFTGYAPSISASFVPNPALNDTIVRGPYQLPIPAYVFGKKPDGSDDINLLWGVETNNNVFAQQALNNTRYSLLRNMGTAYIQFEPIPGLKIKGKFSGDWYYNRRNEWIDFNTYLFSQTPGNPYSNNDGTSKGQYGERHTRNSNLIKEFSINYTKSFGKHGFDVLLNAMDQRYVYEFIGGSSSQINSANPLFRNVNNQIPFSNSGSFRTINALQGYMGRISYNFDDKYLIDVTVRRDGSSRFAPGYKWGTFPSFALAWRISREGFMSNLKFINDLKIRAGWGKLGNQETASFAYLSKISTTPDYSTGSGPGNGIGNVRFGVSLPDFPVKNLSWETATTSNLGFDGVFLNNKITATVEYYSRVTSGILQAAQLPASVGNQNQPILNIASVKNSGVELELGYNGKVGQDFNFNISGNLTTVKNQVTKVFLNQPFGGEQGRIEVGYPINFLWGYQVGGIFQNQQQIDQWKETHSDATNGNTFSPGDMYFQDVRSPSNDPNKTYENKPDGTVSPYDRTYLGKTIPGFYYGLNLSMNWKGFDVSIFFQGVGDVQKVNYERWAGESMSSTGVNQWRTVLNRWTSQNPSSTMPRAVRNDPAGNTRFSSRWVESAAFMRLKNLQIGYTLPASLISKLGGMDRCRIYLSGTNVLTFTKWSGTDPENDILPPPRTYTLGLSATF